MITRSRQTSAPLYVEVKSENPVRLGGVFVCNKKVALRDKARGYLVCVPLAGIEPATLPLVRRMLYPMSYSGTQLGI